MAPILTRPPSGGNLDLQNEMLPLGEYIFLRVLQANPNMKTILGIPGDFNLNLMEHMYASSVALKARFVGLCNELNAAYTACGYARRMSAMSVLITTYGVGELSALNGIAGAFAEYSPVLHIVGTTRIVQKQAAESITDPLQVWNIHHLVQNKNPLKSSDHQVYEKLVEPFSVAQESLIWDGEENASGVNLDKIDRVLVKIIQESRPGYLFIPADIPDTKVPKSRLSVPLDVAELKDEISKDTLQSLVSRILNKLCLAREPSVLVDALVSRFGYAQELSSFILTLPPYYVKLFSTNCGRFSDETLVNFVGTYAGGMSPTKEIKTLLEDETDFLLHLGKFNVEVNYKSDFSRIRDVVVVHPDYIYIDGEYIYTKDFTTDSRIFSIGDFLKELTTQTDILGFIHHAPHVGNINYKYNPKLFHDPKTLKVNGVVTQKYLVDFFNSYLQPNDVLVCDTCTFQFALADLKIPKGVQFVSQSFFGSIGYALPATLGVSLAEKDLGAKRRVILVEGDGSAQMTVQEWSSYLRNDIQPPKIFLLNNSGYTVERLIEGPTRSYNDIQSTWQWTEILKIFGDAECKKHTSAKLSTIKEFDDYFIKQNHMNSPNDKIEFLELVLGKLDAPERFEAMVNFRTLC